VADVNEVVAQTIRLVLAEVLRRLEVIPEDTGLARREVNRCVDILEHATGLIRELYADAPNGTLEKLANLDRGPLAIRPNRRPPLPGLRPVPVPSPPKQHPTSEPHVEITWKDSL